MKRVALFASCVISACAERGAADETEQRRDGIGLPTLVRSLAGAVQQNPSSDPDTGGGAAELGGGVSIFVAHTELDGDELWRTDGTAAGTSLIRDIWPGPISSQARAFVAADGRVFFLAQDGVHGNQLWETDGTFAGTRMAWAEPYSVRSIELHTTGAAAWLLTGSKVVRADRAGAAVVATSSTVRKARAVGNRLYVVQELTSLSAILSFIDSADAGLTGALPCDVCLQDPDLYAGATKVFVVQPQGVVRVASSDGVSLSQYTFGAPFNSMFSATPQGDTLYFSVTGTTATDAGLELWTSDGTDAGKVMTITPVGVNPQVAHGFSASGSLVFFWGNDGAKGVELWRTDGTAAGTFIARDLAPGAAWGASSYSDGILPVTGGVFTIENAPNLGVEPIFSDGTDAGTVVFDLEPGFYGSQPLPYFSSGGGAYFFATSPFGQNWELWHYTPGGTPQQTKDLNVSRLGEVPTELAALGDQLLFAWNDGDAGSGLWVSDGQQLGTRRLDVDAPTSLLALGGRAFFNGSTLATGRELFVTDGTLSGTQVALELQPDAGSSGLTLVGAVGSKLILLGPGNGSLLAWSEDAGVQSIGPMDGGNLYASLNAGGELFFLLENRVRSLRQLWRTDGTALDAGTRLVSLTTDGVRPWLTGFNGVPYLSAVAIPPGGGADLYRPGDDGGLAGLGVSGAQWLTVAGGRLWFTSGPNLYSTDGAAVVRTNLSTTVNGESPTNLTGWGAQLLFQFDDDGFGPKYWAMDTADAGLTRLNGPIATMSRSVNVAERFTTTAQGVLFPGGDVTSGNELWGWPGPGNSTRQLSDVNPGRGNSNPSHAVAVGAQLFFVAEDVDAPTLQVLSLTAAWPPGGGQGGSGGSSSAGGGTASTGGGNGGGNATAGGNGSAGTGGSGGTGGTSGSGGGGTEMTGGCRCDTAGLGLAPVLLAALLSRLRRSRTRNGSTG